MANFRKAHYEVMAKAIASQTNAVREAMAMMDGGEPSFDAGALYGLRQVAINLAHELERDNPRFDRKRFLKACGWGE